ncbi:MULTISPECIES: gp16 family protein [unclassified Pseudomonas]|uniref:gp16 family protein n=1 Tax=unclassified Pseudomonas TaxID=196821 RepID=UPI000DA74FA3|nr:MULTISPECIES: regulatory protein GemA [unclassified Pseudomonas]MDW3715329.1 regulatory protein GemA [Pseudomonas sp. 2023EL-01195]PZE10549.1 regulatory protein GemA [Pseudomonas sp. 57B-090624]
MKSPGLTKIQIARRQLGMDDDTYRAMLKRTVGAESSKGLTPRQVGRVLAELERLGFEPTGKAKMPTDRQVAEPPPERKALVFKIGAQLASAGRPWAYADAIAQRMFQVDRVEWCEPDQLRRLVVALTYDAKRHEGEK